MAAGRPRSFCTEKALDSAMQVFWRKGYEGASMAELTEAMGMNKPSIYAAFGNKEELFRQGDAGDSLFIVLEGDLDYFRKSDEPGDDSEMR